MNIHFIAIGGSVMHNLAIALKAQGHHVTGSDDHIFDPSKSRLQAEGLLPEAFGWFPEKVSKELDAVILGMHAQNNNPELLAAQELELPIYSYPEFIYQQSINKQRVAIAGSHGKTTVTSMVIHVLHYWGRKFDYLVGAVPNGLNATVRLSEDAPIIVVEADEYPTSPLDSTPKFLHYKHHIGAITGIAWDHYNAYPSLNGYLAQFKAFAEATPKAGTLVNNAADKTLEKLLKGSNLRKDIARVPYEAHKSSVKNGQTFIPNQDKALVPLRIFGKHNLLNLNAALGVCQKIGVSAAQFYEAIASFEGAPLRLQLLAENAHSKVFRDFAHAPSKATAAVEAVKSQFPKQRLVACLELHTYSSLNKDFVAAYKNSLKKADVAAVYYNPETARRKQLETMEEATLKNAFGRKDLLVFTNAQAMQAFLESQTWEKSTLLLMSSGDFGGLNIQALAKQLIG